MNQDLHAIICLMLAVTTWGFGAEPTAIKGVTQKKDVSTGRTFAATETPDTSPRTSITTASRPNDPDVLSQPSRNRDQIVSNLAKTGNAQVAQPEPPDGSTVAYTAFDGTEYSLVQYNGAYVAFLIKPGALQSGVYTLTELRAFIDHLDVLYAHFKELTGREPADTSYTGTHAAPLLHIAFVLIGGSGLGYQGAKGIELDPSLLEVSSLLYPDKSHLFAIAMHEMAHNFDFYTSFIVSGAAVLQPSLEIPHVWTNFMIPYVNEYSQEGELGDYLPGFLQRYVEAYFYPYLSSPSFTWSTCVESTSFSCNSVLTQAGMLLRMAQLHGPAGVKSWLAYLGNAIETRQLVASRMDDLAKNDLLLESLAYGNKVDPSCYVDAWRWPISSGLRAQLSAAFGSNPNCLDQDKDGYTPVQDDLDDHDPSIHPGATEAINGVDDDCDGVVDDSLVERTPSTAGTMAVPFPARIRGNILNNQQTDFFRLTVSSAKRVWFAIRGIDPPLSFPVVLVNGPDGFVQIAPISEDIVFHRMRARAVDLPSGTWDFLVGSGTPSNYEAIVYPVTPWLSALTAPPPGDVSGGAATFFSPVLPEQLKKFTTLSARFWVEGVGWVGAKPLDSSGAVSLRYTLAPGDARCALSYRVQFVSGDLPVSPTGQPAVFYPYGTSCLPIVQTVSAASYVGPRLAPEAIASSFGDGLAATALGAATVPLPTTLAGAQVLVKDATGTERLAPLFYVSQSQVNYQIPPGTAIGPATLKIVGGGERVSTGSVEIGPVAPGLFSANANGQGVAAAQAVRVGADGKQTWVPVFQCTAQASCVSVPIDLGTAADSTSLVLFGTGIRGRTSLANVTCTVGGGSAEVFYAGAQGTFIGLDQVNLLLPQNLAGRGEVNVTLTTDGQPANIVTINVK